MKKLIITALMICLPVMAEANEIYFGSYIDARYRAAPAGGKASFVSGVTLDRTFHKRITPHMNIETLMDKYNGNGSFRPASVKYDLGIRADIYQGSYLDLSRMCWHSIDRPGTEEYWLLKAGYKW